MGEAPFRAAPVRKRTCCADENRSLAVAARVVMTFPIHPLGGDRLARVVALRDPGAFYMIAVCLRDAAYVYGYGLV